MPAETTRESITWLMPPDAARLRSLCNLFSINYVSTEDNQPAALEILIYLYSMPTITDHGERRRYGIKILQRTNAQFPPSSGTKAAAFFGMVQARVIEMQEFPSWFNELTRTPEDLARRYVVLAHVVKWMGLLGFGASASAFGAGVKEAMKVKPKGITEGMTDDEIKKIMRDMRKKQVETAAKTMGTRLSGRGPILEGIEARYSLPPGAALAFFILAVAGTAVYFALVEELRIIQIILLDKFQNGQISNDLYKKVFKEVPPERVRKYWEIQHWED